MTKQSIKEQFPDSSRSVADIAVQLIYDNPGLFCDIADLCLGGEMPYASRAARAIAICSIERPDLFLPMRKTFIRALNKTKNEAVIRNLLKIYTEIPITFNEDEKSVLMNRCFEYLNSNEMPVAIQVYSMDVLFRLSSDYPEIGFAMYSILDSNIDSGSAGYRSKARKIMKALKKKR